MDRDDIALKCTSVRSAAEITVELLKHRDPDDAKSEANAITTFKAVYRGIRDALCSD